MTSGNLPYLGQVRLSDAERQKGCHDCSGLISTAENCSHCAIMYLQCKKIQCDSWSGCKAVTLIVITINIRKRHLLSRWDLYTSHSSQFWQFKLVTCSKSPSKQARVFQLKVWQCAVLPDGGCLACQSAWNITIGKSLLWANLRSKLTDVAAHVVHSHLT